MVLLLALLACTPGPPPPEACATTWYADRDGDNYGDPEHAWTTCERPSSLRWTTDSRDCDDSRLDVHPQAEDVCDGVDQDCDGIVDEEPPTWFRDDDNDGFGDPDTRFTSCEAPAGAVSESTDCDDTRGDVNPGAREVCDGADQDCDGTVDENPPNSYTDADSDGYGDPAEVFDLCPAPAGSVLNGSDCDDARDDVHPSAIETCDGADQDCDGNADETDTWADADGDGHGDPGGAISVCETAPPSVAPNSDDCDDGAADVHPGAAETCDDVDHDCDGTNESWEVWADAYEDFDGDGYGNAAVYVGTVSCNATFYGVHNSLDCDDLRWSTHPGATEICDGQDDDCDGVIDDGLDAWYADTDGDGYGAGARLPATCEGPSGSVSNAEDCDDSVATVFPGAAELCDGLANDCNAVSAWTPADEDGTASRENADGSWEDLTGSFSVGFHDAPPAATTTWLCNGIHEGTFEVTEDDVTIEGRNGADETTLAWTTSIGDPAVAVWMASRLTVRGLTITEGTATGTSSYTVAGLDARYADSLLVEDCTIAGLRADRASAGAEIHEGSSRFHRVVFADNETASDGAALLVVDATVDIEHASFDANTAASSGGALTLGGASTVTCATSSFDGNAASSGGAVSFLSGSTSTFAATGCDFGATTANSPDDVAMGAAFSWIAASTRTFVCDAAATECR